MLVAPAQPRVTSLRPLAPLQPCLLVGPEPPSCSCPGACALDPSAWNEPPPRAEAATSLLAGPTVLAWPWLLSSLTAFLRAQPRPFCAQHSLSARSCGAILGFVGSGGAGVGDGRPWRCRCSRHPTSLSGVLGDARAGGRSLSALGLSEEGSPLGPANPT